MSLSATVLGPKISPAGEQSQLLVTLYDELRKLARWKMTHEGAHTLQPTALVHEAWLRLGADDQPVWKNRAHFFGAAAEAMRRILVEKARRRAARRHGGDHMRVELNENENTEAYFTSDSIAPDDRLVQLSEALEKLSITDPKKAELVKLRYFAGLSIKEAAETLDISEATAIRWWAFARAWLFEEISAT